MTVRRPRRRSRRADSRGASGPRTLAKKDTGSYAVRLVRDGGAYALDVQYTGKNASDLVVRLDLEGEGVDDARPAEMKAWFKAAVRGDLDVGDLLAQGGYTEYTGLLRRPRPVRIVL